MGEEKGSGGRYTRGDGLLATDCGADGPGVDGAGAFVQHDGIAYSRD
jgi:hypothetical protein